MELELLLNLIEEQYNLFDAFSFKKKIINELTKCSRKNESIINIAVAYITYSGIKEFIPLLKKILESNGKIRILTCLDFGTTEIEAIKALLEIKKNGNLDIRLYNNPKGNYHPKFYLFSNSEERASIIGSNNITYYALSNNIECAIFSDDNILFENLSNYFIYLWRESNFINNEILSEYSLIKPKIEIQNVVFEKSIQQIYANQPEEIVSNEDIEDIEKQIKVFREFYGTTSKIVFWRDVALDEIIALLKESYRLKDIKQRELVIDMIHEDLLHYKSDGAIGSHYNYTKFMCDIGLWDDSGLTILGKLALEKYKKSKLEFLLFIQFLLLVIGNLISLCIAVNLANDNNFGNFPLDYTILKEEWINNIHSEVNEILTEKNLGNIGKDSLKRYHPTLFNKYGFEGFIKKRRNTIYDIKLAGLIRFIRDYIKILNSDIREFQDNFVGDI